MINPVQRFFHFGALWLPPILWMGLIFFLSSQPGLKIAEGSLDFWTRKPAHVFEYAVLYLFFYRALKGTFDWRISTFYLGAGVLSLFYALTDEFHQIFVPLREGRLIDLGFDLLGILVAIIFLRLWLRFSSPRV